MTERLGEYITSEVAELARAVSDLSDADLVENTSVDLAVDRAIIAIADHITGLVIGRKAEVERLHLNIHAFVDDTGVAQVQTTEEVA